MSARLVADGHEEVKRALVVALVLLAACKKSGGADAGLDPSTLLPECENADGRARADSCYDKHATKVQKAAFCERIVAPGLKNACFDRIASATNDETLCPKIDTSGIRSSCFSRIAKQKQDPAVCKKVEKHEMAASCLREVALRKDDPAICDAIEDKESKDHFECLVGLAGPKPELCDRLKTAEKDACLAGSLEALLAPTQNDGRCDRISDTSVKELCWERVARTDPLLCEKLTDKAKCYRTALHVAGDETTCPKISMPESADQCWKEVAVRANDAKLCDKVKGDKKACTEAVENRTPESGEALGITKVSATQFIVTREAANRFFGDFAEAAKSARIVPEVQDGKVMGMKLFGIRPNKGAGAVGLQNGDRIEKVNGLDLTGPDEAMAAYAKLKNASRIELQLTRRGQPMTITYTIK